MGLLFILFFGFLLMKMPVAFCMICSSMIYSMVQGESIQMLLSRAVAGSSSFTLLALGFFILAGNIMNRGVSRTGSLAFVKSWSGGFREDWDMPILWHLLFLPECPDQLWLMPEVWERSRLRL